MSDLISRQAAIEAICKACSMEEDYQKCDGYPETSTWCDELVALRALPSAQPEIIRCKDCYHAEDDITHMFCVYFHHKVYGDDYCSNAVKRREDGEA